MWKKVHNEVKKEFGQACLCTFRGIQYPDCQLGPFHTPAGTVRDAWMRMFQEHMSNLNVYVTCFSIGGLVFICDLFRYRGLVFI